jgi:site-specific DNA-methyltransferase (adenine-specific)
MRAGRFPANVIHDGSDEVVSRFPVDGNDTAARFFYTAKASRSERGADNRHPTVKPLDLMRYLIRLVTPPGGVVLDPFAGSGSTLVAARDLGFSAIGIEINPEYIELIEKRCALPWERTTETDAEQPSLFDKRQ